VLVLDDDGDAVGALGVFDRGRGHNGGRHHGHHSTLLSLLLQVKTLKFISVIFLLY